jgi:hypothetical protein
MKTFFVLAVGIVLEYILSMVTAAPYAGRCPDGPTRPFATKGISGFWGNGKRRESTVSNHRKIDEEKQPLWLAVALRRALVPGEDEAKNKRI